MQVNSSRRQWRAGRAVAGASLAVLAVGAWFPAAGSAAASPRTGPPATALTAAPLVPVGAVTGSGCTGDASAASCHLYAVAGSVTLPGQTAAVPVWKFRDTATAPATGALTGTGPVLVVNSGATVALTLDNVNVPDPVSLAVPGLTGFVDDRVGVASGAAAKTYTFTAGRPGTYLYEAGHTQAGARQALMGLVGALIVRPSGFVGGAAGTASDLGPTSVPGSGFDDEAVLLLGDLDPAFAAAPQTYDLRKFSGTYRTINGKVYPDTDQIPTAKGNSVLLRYLNAGAVNHSMGVQGLRQSVIAENSYGSTGISLAADQLSPGQTEDVLVKVADEGNYTVADTGGALDTAGMTVGTTRQVAFGGMMTLLGTNVTPPSTDTVGPRSSIDTMAPNPAKVTTPVTLTMSFTDPATGGPSAITSAEVLIDGQAGTVAPGTSLLTFTPTAGATGQASGTFTLTSAVLSTLSQGKHRIYVRALDAAGNWGALTSAVLNLATTGASTSSMSLTPNPTNGRADVTISATGDDSALGGTVDQARYAIDCDPAAPAATCTTGAMTLASPGAATTAETGTLPAVTVAGLGQGTHQVYVQTHDSEGFWGPTLSLDLTVDLTAPTVGGTVISPATTDGTVADPGNPGFVKVTGDFSDVSTGTPAPPASKLVAAEGIFPAQVAGGPAGTQVAPTGSDDGKGFTFVAKDGAFSSTAETAYGLIPLSQLTAYPDGTYQVWMHAKDAAGNWGTWTPASFVIKRGLFADGFEAGNLTAWTGGTIPAPPGTRLAVQSAAASGGSFGLAVTGSGTAPAYLISPTITPAATSYHARFTLHPNTMRTGTGQVGILTAIQSGSVEPFQVQYRRGTGNNAAAQVRLVVTRANNSTASTAWLSVPTTSASSLQVDWTAGTNAGVTFTVRGTASTLTGQNTSARSIAAVRFGLLDASTAVTGTAYLDGFVSSLNPLP